MPRLLAAASLAALIFALPAWAQSSGSAKAHIAAAKKAERAKNFKKMLAEYQASCAAEPSNECQLGIADAYARLGDKEKARGAYETLINDPFAQGKFIARAKGALAKLDGAPPSLDLPSGPPALDGPPSLDLPAVTASDTSAKSKKKKGKKVAQADAPPPSLDLPPLDALPTLPDQSAASSTKKKDKGKRVARLDSAPPALDMPPALDTPPADTSSKKKKKGKKDTAVATREAPPALDGPPPALDDPPPTLDGPPPTLDGPPPTLDTPPAIAQSDTPPAVAADEPPPAVYTPAEGDAAKKDTKLAANTTGSKTGNVPSGVDSSRGKTVPKDALIQPVAPTDSTAKGGTKTTRILAYVATGVAVAGLGGGAFMFKQAGSKADDLHNGIHSRAENNALIADQKSARTLSAVGLMAGIAAGGAAAILFTF